MGEETPGNKVLSILARKLSRKAALIGMAMVLIYLLAVTPTVTSLLVCICVIAGLAVFGSLLQWSQDGKESKKM